MPQAVTSIGANAFSGCGIADVDLKNITWMGASAFENSGITHADLTRVTRIETLAFANSALTEVTMKSLVTLGAHAFYGCTGLTSVTIPDTVEEIGPWAFSDAGITSVVLPFLDYTVSDGQHGFTDIFLRCPVRTITLTMQTSVTETTFHGATTSLESVTLQKVQTIGEGTFQNFTALSEVNFGDGLTTVGARAFAGSGLTQALLPNSVRTVGEEAFRGCKALAALTLQEGITETGARAFSDCILLTAVSVPVSVTQMGAGILMGCSSLQTLILPFIGETADAA